MVICCLVTVVTAIGNIICQERKIVRNDGGSDLAISIYKEIPEATEQCAPAACEWWKQLRAAGNDLLGKGDEKSKRKFVTLFVEGLERSYRIPLKDRPPQMLSSVRPAPLHPGVRMKNGKVSLSVEFSAGGSVGEVKVVNGVRPDMDERCMRATRQIIFLPAVKDGVFVTDWQSGGCSFHSR